MPDPANTATTAPVTTPAQGAAPSATTPAASTQSTPGTQPGSQPSATTPAAATPAKPPIDTKAILEQRKLQKKLADAEALIAKLKPDAEITSLLRDKKTRSEALYKRLGISYDDLTNEQLSTLRDKVEDKGVQLPPEVRQELDELKAHKKALEDAEAARTANEQRSTAVNNAKKFVTDNAERMPYTAALELHEVFLNAYVAETAKNEGVPPDDAEFAAGFESALAQRLEGQLKALSQTGTGKALLQRLLGQPASPAPDTGSDGDKKGGAPARLTNDLSATPTAGIDLTSMDASALRTRAAKALRA